MRQGGTEAADSIVKEEWDKLGLLDLAYRRVLLHAYPVLMYEI